MATASSPDSMCSMPSLSNVNVQMPASEASVPACTRSNDFAASSDASAATIAAVAMGIELAVRFARARPPHAARAAIAIAATPQTATRHTSNRRNSTTQDGLVRIADRLAA